MNKNITTMLTMNRLNDFLQIIGVLGLIASLIFVGLELRQSHKIALAKTQQERNNAIRQLIMNSTLSGIDWQSTTIENKVDYEFTLKEIARRNSYHDAWFLYENDFFQYSQGLITDEVWLAKVRAFEYWYNLCDMRELFEVRSRWMPAEMIELINTFPDKCNQQ